MYCTLSVRPFITLKLVTLGWNVVDFELAVAIVFLRLLSFLAVISVTVYAAT